MWLLLCFYYHTIEDTLPGLELHFVLPKLFFSDFVSTKELVAWLGCK